MSEVLVVDDDTAIRETLRSLLEELGHSVIEASDGVEALVRLRQASGRLLVLLDLVMPEVDGRAVLRAVASDVQLRDRHAFIVLTAGNDSLVTTISPYVDALRVQVVRKPFDIEDLLAASDSVLARLMQPVRGRRGDAHAGPPRASSSIHITRQARPAN